MASIVNTIEIARTPEEVFPYVTDPSTFPEWQHGLLEGRMEDGPHGVGARCVTTRRIGGAAREITSELTEYDPPRRWADHGLDGPIRGVVGVTVTPLEGGTRSRVTIELDFEGRGIGRVLVPLVVRPQARREMRGNVQALKERLER